MNEGGGRGRGVTRHRHECSRTVAVLGGTFDPVHAGHVAVARAVLDRSCCDQLWLMPVASPPHKNSPQLTSGTHRVAMLELAFSGMERVTISNLELERGGRSYTYHTVLRLNELHHDTSFKWVIGADMISDLPNWFEIERLAEQISFIGLTRPGFSVNHSALPEYVRNRLEIVPMPALDISSTKIRQMLRKRQTAGSDESLHRWLVPTVMRYIEENGLYEN